jgi:CDP-glucose 4,6-dehydratase
VLDCLNGYITLSNELLDGRGQGEWNFGPDTDSFVAVGQVASLVADLYGISDQVWTVNSKPQPHEANLLSLDARKAELELNWHNKLDFQAAVRWTVNWNIEISSPDSSRDICIKQISDFQKI